MVIRFFDQVTKDRIFVPRNDRTTKVEDRSKSEDGKQENCRHLLAEGKCSKRESCSFKLDMSKKGKGEAHVIDRVLVPKNLDYQARTVKMGKEHQKDKSRRVPASMEKRTNFRVTAA